jgi:uroporphyrinogen decarboxylase
VSPSSSDDQWLPLPCQEVVKAVERRGPVRIPLVMAKWWGEGLEEHCGECLGAFDRYPEDAAVLLIEPLEAAAMGLSWEIPSDGAHDSRSILTDWGQLDEFIAKMPDPETAPQFDEIAGRVAGARSQGRYLLFGWWRLFFEKPWAIRGMQNLLMDYYLAPEMVHRLNEALCDLYCSCLTRAIREFSPDGFWTSDDLGHQTQSFMSPATFREFLKPYYWRIGATLQEHGVHWWLHSCGNNAALLGDLVEAGVDVFHPVQKGTMDEVSVAREFGDRLTFLAGIDVQHALQEKTPEGVRQEVRFLIDTFDRPDGGMCIAAGNGILPGTPLENIEAFLDEALRYGTEHRRRFAGR